ncbi:hypothetical protein LAZ67_2003064 [Cordylochernes scorpioides]|uniref:Retrovirus-related Pol polyprotein from transposon TNT 1-94 n=1 Tax=Cordylochernes scorpioides TaxID=51811 RepID=A0ABY6K5X7_9ARAC|nr:hypothetical protein LAZ67_2003064 [Cordylochernes scorpioides]
MEPNQYDGCGGGSQQTNKKRPRPEDEDLLPSSHHQFKFNSTANLFNFGCRTFETIIAVTSLDTPEKIQMATRGLMLTLVQETELLLEDAFKGASLGRPNPTANVPIPSTSFASVVAEKDKPVRPPPPKPKAKATFVNLAPSFESHVVVKSANPKANPRGILREIQKIHPSLASSKDVVASINTKARVDGEVRDEEICESFRSNHSVQSLQGKRDVRVVHRSNNAAHSTSTVFIEVDNQVAEILGQHGRIPVAGLMNRSRTAFLKEINEGNFESRPGPASLPYPPDRRQLSFSLNIEEITTPIIFTDGSKNEAGVGAAIVPSSEDQQPVLLRLHPDCTAFQAELLAIRWTVRLVEEGYSREEITIASDCKSALSAICTSGPVRSTLVAEIIPALNTNQNVNLCWVPGHCGIDGNERADRAAKNAAVSTLEPSFSILPRSLARNHSRTAALDAWTEVYCRDHSNRHLRRIAHTPDRQLQFPPKWLKEIKAPSGRLFRWRLRLSRYEYEVRSINGVQQYETDVGTRDPPEDEVEFKEWKKKDAQAKGIITCAMTDSLVALILNCKTSKDIWIALHERYEGDKKKRIIEARNDVSRLTMRKEENWEEYLYRAEKLLEQARNLGAEIEDLEFTTSVIRGLPQKYNLVALQLNCQMKASISDLKNFLKLYHERFTHEEKEGNSKAFNTIHKESFSNSKHFHKNRNGNKPICFICAKPGHKAIECWHNPKNKRGSENKQTAKNKPEHQNKAKFVNLQPEEHVSNIKEYEATQQPEEWVIDSGASCHMTSNRDLLKEEREVHTTIKLADNSEIISNAEGAIEFEGQNKLIRLNDVLYFEKLSEETIPETSEEKENHDDHSHSDLENQDEHSELPYNLRPNLKDKLYYELSSDDEPIEDNEDKDPTYDPTVGALKLPHGNLLPSSYEEAINHPDSPLWQQAMDKEIHSLQNHHVWDLTELPEGAKAIKSKWIFSKKMDPQTNQEIYKARLVALGCSQEYGTDYTETFYPVMKTNSFRTLLAYATMTGYEFHHFDLETAFLYGKLSETIYMTQPPGYQDDKKNTSVCILNQALYGLKQSGRV